MAFPLFRTSAFTAGLLLLAGTAQAHTGHGAHSLMQGLMHPFGLDHLLAMLAVGVWSVSTLPARQTWQGPAAFMLALLLGAALSVQGLQVPYLEHAISLSVVLFGVMLMAVRQALPKTVGLGLLAAAGSLHGLAHGAEAPALGMAGYAAGFLLTTAVLHATGVLAGQAIHRHWRARATLAVGTLGALLGSGGAFLFAQLAA